MAIYVPAGSKIFIQSAIGAAQNVTGLTLAKPPVATAQTTAPANGDYVAFLNMVGPSQLNDGLVKAANVNGPAKTFELKDQDTTGYSALISGQMQVVTLGTELTTASEFSFSGGGQQFAEYKVLSETTKRKIPTETDGIETQVKVLWDPMDAVQVRLRQASDTRQKLAMKIQYPNGLEMLFFGYIGFSGTPEGGGNEVHTATVSITQASAPRYTL
ncbi:phage tail protein [Deefgea piscis]|uniref:phage tail protein n=1 Tax=Deefgea piscis TaxID=2739061 RepID=UPI001C7FA38D|nr:phage tail protein [Deefgea piscis]QZA80184.1 phage tail protein [Deefgea piscis]